MSEPKSEPTPEDVERAQELCEIWGILDDADYMILADELARVRAEEREACAQVADDEVGEPFGTSWDDGSADVARRRVAKKIRARGSR